MSVSTDKLSQVHIVGRSTMLYFSRRFRLPAAVLLLVLLCQQTRGQCTVNNCIDQVAISSMELTPEQHLQIDQSVPEIEQLRATCEENVVSCENLVAEPIVRGFTNRQKNAIRRRYGSFFRGPDDPPESVGGGGGSGGHDDSDESSSDDRRRRYITQKYLCPPTGVYKDVRFALNGLLQLLQMIQISTDETQWILTESCYKPMSDMENVICFERQRYIQAVVVNLDTQVIDVENVQVSCCTAALDVGAGD